MEQTPVRNAAQVGFRVCRFGVFTAWRFAEEQAMDCWDLARPNMGVRIPRSLASAS